MCLLGFTMHNFSCPVRMDFVLDVAYVYHTRVTARGVDSRAYDAAKYCDLWVNVLVETAPNQNIRLLIMIKRFPVRRSRLHA
jgi:hypothetical protein